MARTAKGVKIKNAGVELGDFDVIDLNTGLLGADEGNNTVGFSATGSGSAPPPVIPPEAPDGVRTTFTFATKPKWVSRDGANTFETSSWTYAGTTLTFTDGTPPTNSIAGFL